MQNRAISHFALNPNFCRFAGIQPNFFNENVAGVPDQHLLPIAVANLYRTMGSVFSIADTSASLKVTSQQACLNAFRRTQVRLLLTTHHAILISGGFDPGGGIKLFKTKKYSPSFGWVEQYGTSRKCFFSSYFMVKWLNVATVYRLVKHISAKCA